MSDCQQGFRELWQLRLSHQEKLGQRWEFSCFGTLVSSFMFAIFSQVIAAEGEQNASRALKEAADVLDESPAALQLRYLQTLNQISAERNHTYVFPLPLDLLTKLFGRSS